MYKIIYAPNLGQDYYTESMYLDNLPKRLADKLCEVLNKYWGEQNEYYYKVEKEDYVLVDAHFEP